MDNPFNNCTETQHNRALIKAAKSSPTRPPKASKSPRCVLHPDCSGLGTHKRGNNKLALALQFLVLDIDRYLDGFSDVVLDQCRNFYFVIGERYVKGGYG